MNIEEFVTKFITSDYDPKRRLYDYEKKYCMFKDSIYIEGESVDGRNMYMVFLSKETDPIGCYIENNMHDFMTTYMISHTIEKLSKVYLIDIVMTNYDKKMRDEYIYEKYTEILDEYICSSDIVKLILDIL